MTKRVPGNRVMTRREPRAAALLGVAALALCGPVAMNMAEAAPLEPEACTALSAERANLLRAGVEADMSRGAAWARQNLADDRLLLIKRLIEVNEQLSFRCGIMVTERPTLIQRAPAPEQAAATPPGIVGEKPNKPTKSKPKPASTPVAGVPGSKPKPQPKDAAASPLKTASEPKAVPAAPPAEKPAPTEKAGN